MIGAPVGLPVREVDLTLPVPDTEPAGLDSVLPASRTLSADALTTDSQRLRRARELLDGRASAPLQS